MSILYTAYGFKLDQDTTIRPCGMNTMFCMDNKPISNKTRLFAINKAFQAGYDTLVFFSDDTVLERVELW